jgi:hypothetical protein
VSTHHHTKEEWLEDIEQRQRNVVFPDTAGNEARFWRNLVEDKGKLTAIQEVGVAVMVIAALGLFFITFEMNGLVQGLIDWVLALGFLAAFLGIFTIANRGKRPR